LIWLLFWVLPLQALGLVTAELRGPAHYHDHDRQIGMLADATVLPEHLHAHLDVLRHHHSPTDEAIAVNDGSDHQHDALAVEEGAAGSGTLLSFAALLFRTPRYECSDSGPIRPYSEPKALGDWVAGRIERPPASQIG
jgi:hypothetical protein